MPDAGASKDPKFDRLKKEHLSHLVSCIFLVTFRVYSVPIPLKQQPPDKQSAPQYPFGRIP